MSPRRLLPDGALNSNPLVACVRAQAAQSNPSVKKVCGEDRSGEREDE